MKKKRYNRVIIISFLIAYLLAIVPVPEWALSYRPEWVPMVLVYWVMALPYRINIGSAWVAGLVLDVLEGSTLCLNATALVIIAYVTLNLHLRIRMFSALQQSGLILGLVGFNLVLCHWLQIVTGQTAGWNPMFFMAALTSAIVWPWLFRVMRGVRRTFQVR